MTKIADAVTCVLVNYRTTGLTVAMVDRIRREWAAITVLVCDNSDTDSDWRDLVDGVGTEATTHRLAGNPGFAAGVNVLLRDVRTPYALLINPDVLDLPDLELLVTTAQTTGAAVTAPLVTDESGRVRGTYGGPPTHRTFARYLLPAPAGAGSLMAARRPAEKTSDVGWVTGACMLVEVEAWRLAPFTEELFLYAEDIDFCWRQLDTGRRVVLVADSEVRHTGSASSGGSAPMLWAENLVVVSGPRVRGARTIVAAALWLRACRQFVVGDSTGSRYLRQSARAAWHAGRPR